MDATERRRLIERARWGRKSPVQSDAGLAVTSHPVATRVAADVLRSGGNACDAALAAAVTQTVVEPHMTTITGMLSLLYYDAKTGQTSYVNGCVNAPLAQLPGFSAADVATGRGVSVPGFWAGFEAAREQFGSKPRAELMQPAIALARDGFEVYPFLFALMYEQADRIALSPVGREMYMPDGALLSPGQTLSQPRVAETLQRLAEEGSDYFYRGAFAEKLVETVRATGGVLTREDLERYEARVQEPVRGTYRGYEILAAPPPDYGGSLLIEALNMVELLDLQTLGHPTESAEALYQLILIHNEVFNASARQRDPQSHPLPLETLLSKEYAAMRLKLLQMARPNLVGPAPYPGTNHVTVVDRQGNIASMLHSCMCIPWTNGLFVDGISVAAAGGHYLRSMPQPGARQMCPAVPNIIFKAGQPLLASGSPSMSLLANVLQNLVNLLDFRMTLEESVHLPRFGGASVGPTPTPLTMIEVDIPEKIRRAVADRGVLLGPVAPWSNSCGSFEGIALDRETGLRTSCPDPRRCSAAEAE